MSYFVVENTKILYFSLKRDQFENCVRLCRHVAMIFDKTTNYCPCCNFLHHLFKSFYEHHFFQWRILRGCMCQCVLCCTHADARSFDEYFDSEDEIDIEQFDRPDINKLYMAGKVVHICKIRSVYPRYGCDGPVETVSFTTLLVLIFAQFRAEARKYAKFNTEIMRSVKVGENYYWIFAESLQKIVE